MDADDEWSAEGIKDRRRGQKEMDMVSYPSTPGEVR